MCFTFEVLSYILAFVTGQSA